MKFFIKFKINNNNECFEMNTHLIKRLYAEGTLCLFSGAGQWHPSHISKSFPLTFSCNIYFLSCNLNSLFFVAWGITGSVCIYIYLCFWFWWYSVLQALSNYNSGGEETAPYDFLSLYHLFSPCHLWAPK